MISELASQGTAILMISSELPEILGMSDRAAIVRDGTEFLRTCFPNTFKPIAALFRPVVDRSGEVEIGCGHSLDP